LGNKGFDLPWASSESFRCSSGRRKVLEGSAVVALPMGKDAKALFDGTNHRRDVSGQQCPAGQEGIVGRPAFFVATHHGQDRG
jgi:hypothetical protein